MLTRLGAITDRWTRVNPWTNVYGCARTVLALATAGTILFNSPHEIFRPTAQYAGAPLCFGVAHAGIFCLVKSHLEIGRWLALVILAVVASGWRPRWTAIPHWWVSFSVLSAAVQVGGDQVAAIVSLFLIPVAVTDGRRWHWTSLPQEPPAGTRESVARLVAQSALFAIRLQVAGIYFVSAVAKFGVQQWANGTALYYWMSDARFGSPGWLLPVFRWPLVVTALTWGTMLLELTIALGLLLSKNSRRYLLVLGISFHAGIALTIGITGFSLTMVAALVLLLRPMDEELPLPHVVSAKFGGVVKIASGPARRQAPALTRAMALPRQGRQP